jgi:hypothetical protein
VDDYDIIAETQQTIKELCQRVKFQLIWVKGHYKGNNREFQHDLNDEAHRLASSALH